MKTLFALVTLILVTSELFAYDQTQFVPCGEQLEDGANGYHTDKLDQTEYGEADTWNTQGHIFASDNGTTKKVIITQFIGDEAQGHLNPGDAWDGVMRNMIERIIQQSDKYFTINPLIPYTIRITQPTCVYSLKNKYGSPIRYYYMPCPNSGCSTFDITIKIKNGKKYVISKQEVSTTNCPSESAAKPGINPLPILLDLVDSEGNIGVSKCIDVMSRLSDLPTENPDGVVSLYTSEPLTVYPQPYEDYITFEIEVEEVGKAHLEIYDMRGQIIEEANRNIKTGKQSIKFNIKDKKGQSGVYFYRLTIGNKVYKDKISRINN